MNTKLGPKTRNLEKLKKLGFRVPPFVGIGPDQFKTLGAALKVAHQNLGALRYAVRSSALNEDCATQSMAGQFHTELNVKAEDLESAAKKVLTDAKKKVPLSQFSLLIQEYINFDRAGVCFTRDPNGSPEMVVESLNGGAQQVVQGEATPKQERISWKENRYAEFKAIEEALGHPQDIEWGKKGSELYVLQSRPITTLNKEDYTRIKSMEAWLPAPPYHWEKNELTELAPTPCRHTLHLLKKIYASGGPVEQVYQRLGIHYQALDFLRTIEGELYVDKWTELHTLFPAYDFIEGQAKWKRIKGFWVSIKNQWRLSRPKTATAKEWQSRLIEALEQEFERIDEDAFLKAYEIIFESNLLMGALLNRLKLIHKKESSLPELLSEGSALLKLKFPQANIQPRRWKGNTLDLADRSTFNFRKQKQKKLSKKVQHWWKRLNVIKKTQYEQLLPDVLISQNNRELARQLVVKLKSQLDVNCQHHTKLKSEFPARLTNFVISEEGKFTLSPGEAEGILIPIEKFSNQKNSILLVDELKPELVNYFKSVKGIVTRRGGLLSHLAIIAREEGFPIIRDPNAKSTDIGKKYKILTQ